MNARVLPREEWPGSDVTGFPPFDLRPEDVVVVAVEDAGKLLACMSVVRLTHYEGAWIAPEYRGNAGVVRSLLHAAADQAVKWTDVSVIAGAETGQKGEGMRTILGRLGGVRLPVDFYVLPLGGL